MSPYSIAGEYTDSGLKDEPGARSVSVARFRMRFAFFSPTPPDIAFTSPVYGSMITIADWNCCEVLFQGFGKFSTSRYTLSTQACISGSRQE